MLVEPYTPATSPFTEAPLPEMGIGEKTRLLRKVITYVSTGLPERTRQIERSHSTYRIIADAGKVFAHTQETGFPTIFYGLGATDVAGVRDFLPPSGGTVWSIGRENFTLPKALLLATQKTPSNQLWIEKEELFENQLNGLYRTPNAANQPLIGVLGLAINLAIAGITPENVSITHEQTFHHEGLDAQLTTLALFDGQRHITWHIVSGIDFPSIGETMDPVPLSTTQIALVRQIIASQNKPNQLLGPILGVSKASHTRGVYGLLPILQEQPAPVYTILDHLRDVERANLAPYFETWRKLKGDIPDNQQPSIWGYQAHLGEIVMGKLRTSQLPKEGAQRKIILCLPFLHEDMQRVVQKS